MDDGFDDFYFRESREHHVKKGTNMESPCKILLSENLSSNGVRQSHLWALHAVERTWLFLAGFKPSLHFSGNEFPFSRASSSPDQNSRE